MITQNVNIPQHVAYGDNATAEFQVSEFPDTVINEVFVKDWRGTYKQSTLPRTNYVDSAIFGSDTSLSVDFINAPQETGIDAPDGSNDAVRCYAFPDNSTFDVQSNAEYIEGDNDFNNTLLGTNKIVLANTNATIVNGAYFYSFYYRIKLGSNIAIISPETGDTYNLDGELNEWARLENVPVTWSGGACELNITIQNNELAIIDFFGGQIEFNATTSYIKTLSGAETLIDYFAEKNKIFFSLPPAYNADILWTGKYSYDAFDFNKTIISQYANSATINRLIYNMSQYINPTSDIKAFYDYVWNVDTAQGFGLDIWGKIVGIKREIEIEEPPFYAGFNNGTPEDWKTMGEAPFYAGQTETKMVSLSDKAYRTLILAKALSNITITTAPAINQLLKNLFPDRGIAYSNDMGAMRMRYTFEFFLLPYEQAIVNTLNILPHGAGVHVSTLEIPYPFLGFNEQGDGVETMSYSDGNAIGLAGFAEALSDAIGDITASDVTQINRTFWGDFETGLLSGTGNHNWKNAPIVDPLSLVELVDDGVGGFYAAFTVAIGEQRATISGMQNDVNVEIFENENSLGQIYEFSVNLDSTWQHISGYANIFEIIALDRNTYDPAFSIDVNNNVISLFFGDVVGNTAQKFAMPEMPINEWVDFRVGIFYKKTTSGMLNVSRKLSAAANYTSILELNNISTLQYSSLINLGAVPNHSINIGLYRSSEAVVSIVYHDNFTRNTSGIGVLLGSGDALSSATGAIDIIDYVAGKGDAIASGSGVLSFEDLSIAGQGDALSSASGQPSITQAVAGQGDALASALGNISVQVPSNVTFFGGFDTGLVFAPNTNNQNWYAQALSTNSSIVIQSGNGSPFSAKFTVPPSGTTGSEACMVSIFQDNNGAILYETGNSGTQVYKFSVMFDASWQPMTSTAAAGRWAIILQIRNASGLFNPLFYINVGDSGGAALSIVSRGGNQNIVTSNTRVFHSDQTLPKSVWIDFVLTIKYAIDNTGFFHLDRKNPGDTTFSRVASIDNVPSLQWNNANPDTGNYYFEMGLYRGPQDPSTSILSFDNFTREPYAVVTTVTVPNLVGMDAATANAAITGAGLLVGTILNQGRVISQTPAAGTTVNQGSSVDYTMSISNISVNVTSSSAQITFTFNEVSQAQIEYGITTSYGSLSAKENSFNYSTHTQNITGLVSNQTYHYRIHGWNQAGLESISNDLTFTTAIPAWQCATPATSSTVLTVSGIDNTGATNVTTAIQNAFNSIGGSGGTVRIPNGTYLVSPNTLALKDNMNLEMDTNAILKMADYSAWTTAIESYTLLRAQGITTKLNIIGGQLVGERDTHPPKVKNFTASFAGTIMTVTAITGTLDIGVLNSKLVGTGIHPYTYITSARAGTGPGGTNPTGGVGQYNVAIVGGGNNGTLSARAVSQYTGQHGFGLNIWGSNHVYVEGLVSKNMWGDGIYIGGVKCTDIKLCSVICDNNRRQGASITWAQNVIIRNSQFINTIGTDPSAGIDIEPNPAPNQSTVDNVQIYDSLFANNAHGGIVAHLPQDTETATLYCRNILAERNIIENNDLFAGVTIQTPGAHIIRNNIIRNNIGNGVIYDYRASNGSITGNTIYGNTSTAILMRVNTTNNTISGNVTNTGAPASILDQGTNIII